jgi:hypothetical protein
MKILNRLFFMPNRECISPFLLSREPDVFLDGPDGSCLPGESAAVESRATGITWIRESLVRVVSIIASGWIVSTLEGIRDIAGLCAGVSTANRSQKIRLYNTMYLTIYVYTSNITIQRYIKKIILCNT